MVRLVAHFEVMLPGQCLVAWPEEKEIWSNCTIKEFDVSVQFIVDPSHKFKHKDDELWTYIIHHILVRVSREEDEAPPIVIPDEKGILDYRIQGSYFSERKKEYGAVAQEVVNRLIRFFKFKLKTPYLTELLILHNDFQNAKWTDQSGNEIRTGGATLVVRGVPGLRGELGVQKLMPESIKSLHSALQDPISPSLHEEIISDAQTALFQKNFRRAVFELAIACEIAIKGKYFSEDSPAGMAFEYLEDKGQVKVRVLDFIDRIAKEAIGKSFRSDYSEHYQNIDHLFRCRNKIAHRGALLYRDDSGVAKIVDCKTISSWWNSVSVLIEWINT